MNVVATADCRTEQDARTIGDAMRGLISLGRLSVPETQPDVLRLYDAVKVDQQERTIKIVAAVAPELIDKFIAMTDTVPRPRPPGMRSRPPAR